MARWPKTSKCPKGHLYVSNDGCPKCRESAPGPDAPATQHRVIPVEWHRVAVEPARKMPISGGGHVVDPEEDNAPARVDRERVCANCEKWVYYDNGDVTFHCGCNAHWKWRDVPAAQPANTDGRQADTIPDDLKRDYEDARGGGHFSYGNYHVASIIERTGRAETRIEVLEAALHRIYSWCEAYPLEVFPAPDLQRDRELLGDAEFTRLNAHSMRHVVEGIKKIAALAAPSGGAQGEDMRKLDELRNPNSCMVRAKDDEMTFVLLGRDVAAPSTIRHWVELRIAHGKNKVTDPQILEALECARAMERERAQ